ncbi:hypothetical protein F441_10862 [Phytophthora nicotianae CJ01A1]|uniref:Uncharacterized protein n=1 Tax=Phytophthora nicotianae CJ01A1 TaxID=1317063 RepID=W2WUG1_PHYNI|nr:hypothetical protein F441_10862 [Phytophthora nicotianae CJ01A1]
MTQNLSTFKPFSGIATFTSYTEVSATENEKKVYLSTIKSISGDSTLQHFKDAQQKIDKEI